jgi:hypothetical protein
LYDWRSGERVHKFENEEHKGLVEELHYVRDGQFLLAAGGAQKGFLLLMDVRTGQLVNSIAAPMHIHQLTVSDACDRILAVGHGMIAQWENKPRADTGDKA